MKKAAMLCVAAAISGVAGPVYCADWYLNVASGLGRFESFNASSFYLSVPWSNPSLVNRTSVSGEQCTFNQIQFTAPSADLRKDWLAMAMTAIAAGQRIDVFGACNSSISTLVVSRLVVSFD
jgi:hypothetical protein